MRENKEVWINLVLTLHEVTQFSRLGSIKAPESAPAEEQGISTLLLDAANKVAASKLYSSGAGSSGFTLFTYTDLQQADAAGCREAVDSLFFDEIDALLLDGSACFAPDNQNSAELLELLLSRGIMPISATDHTATEHGALIAPWAGNGERLNRELAAFLMQEGSGMEDATFTPNLPPLFSLNTATAARLGFDPPVLLLVLTKHYVIAPPR
ncbi:MAG: hypothetical protein LBV80_05895 [Deltaproteobacteria bacterium]|nr:hypothetical protein [Deltaproteobacteria bacterium]